MRVLYVKLMVVLGMMLVLGAAQPIVAVAFGVGAGLWIWSGARQRPGARVRIHVDGGRIDIDRGAGRDWITLTFDQLWDVRLDTKAASRNVTAARSDGMNSVFGAASNHNIDLDVSRIEVLTEEGDALLLNEEFFTNMHVVESLRQIRLFLRSHGWLPGDEREDEEDDD